MATIGELIPEERQRQIAAAVLADLPEPGHALRREVVPDEPPSGPRPAPPPRRDEQPDDSCLGRVPRKPEGDPRRAHRPGDPRRDHGPTPARERRPG